MNEYTPHIGDVCLITVPHAWQGHTGRVASLHHEDGTAVLMVRRADEWGVQREYVLRVPMAALRPVPARKAQA